MTADCPKRGERLKPTQKRGSPRHHRQMRSRSSRYRFCGLFENSARYLKVTSMRLSKPSRC